MNPWRSVRINSDSTMRHSLIITIAPHRLLSWKRRFDAVCMIMPIWRQKKSWLEGNYNISMNLSHRPIISWWKSICLYWGIWIGLSRNRLACKNRSILKWTGISGPSPIPKELCWKEFSGVSKKSLVFNSCLGLMSLISPLRRNRYIDLLI